MVCSQPQFGRLWLIRLKCLFTRATLLTTFSISIVTIPRCLIQLAPPCNSTSLFWSLQYSKLFSKEFPSLRLQMSVPSYMPSCSTFYWQLNWLSRIDLYMDGSFLMTKVKEFQSRPDHGCLWDSVSLPQIISYDYDFLCDSAHSGIFSGQHTCTWVSNTLIVFFVLYPYFLWLHEAPGGTTYNFIIGTVCWKIKPTLWPGGGFRNFLEFLFSIYYSKSNQCATGFLWLCVQASFAI